MTPTQTHAALLSDDEINSIWSDGPPGSVLTPWGIAKIRAIEQAVIAKLQATQADHIPDAGEMVTQEPVQAGELPDEREAFEAYARKRGYQRDELDRCRIGIVGPAYYNPNTEMAWSAWQARAALSARKPLIKAGMQSDLNMGAGSCAWTEGCDGVSQQHLERFAALVLEKAAEHCDTHYNHEAKDCADELRAMSAALQYGDRG